MKHLVTVLALALLFGACNQAYQTPQPAAETKPAVSEAEKAKREMEMKKNLSFAYEYYKQHNYAEARDYYLKVFDLDTDYQYASHLKRLATCYTQLGVQDSALLMLELAVEKLPESHYEHRTLGDLYNRSGRKEDALREFRICQELKEEDLESTRDIVRILSDRAAESDELEDWDNVLAELDLLIELDPENPDWPKQKDDILARHYDPEELIASLRQSHQSFPEDTKITRKLATQLVEFATRDTYEEAIPLLDELLAANGEDGRLLDLKARSLEGLGRGYDAASVLVQYSRIDAGNKELPVRIGEVYLNLNDLEKAAYWAGRSKSSFPAYGKGYILMARVYVAAVDRCAGTALSFDDKLVYEYAYNEYGKVGSGPFYATAQAGRKSLAEVLPTKEDRFFNKHEVPKGECYAWLFQ